MESSEQSAPGLVCILVHGTFALDAPWTQEDGLLRKAIAERAGGNVTFETCKWSGLNTHAARIRAGKRFARLVARLRGNPNAQRIVAIAHSHGGNVVAYGGKNVAPSAQVDAVVTLGAPFLDLHPRELESYFRILDICLYGLAMAVLVIPLLVIGHFLFRSPLPTLPDAVRNLLEQVPTSGTFRWLVAAPLYAVVGMIFGFLMTSASFLLYGGRPLVEPAVSKLMPPMVARQKEVMARLGLPVLTARRVLTVSVRFDEAGWLLRSVDAVAQLPFALLTVVGLPAALAVLAFIIVYSFVDSGVGTYYFFHSPAALGHFVARFGSYAFVALGASAGLFLLFQIVVVVLPQIRKIGFFGESVADYALARIATSIVPPNTGNVVVARYAHLHASQKRAWRIGMPGLRHSAIYNDPDVIADTVEWIVNECMPARASSVEQTAETSAASAG